MGVKNQNLLPDHGESVYTVHYEIPNVRPHGWWPVSRGDMKDPSLKSIRDSIDYLICRDWSYSFDRKGAFKKLRELRQTPGLVAIAIKKHRYYATGKPGPDGKPMKIGHSIQTHHIIFPLAKVADV